MDAAASAKTRRGRRATVPLASWTLIQKLLTRLDGRPLPTDQPVPLQDLGFDDGSIKHLRPFLRILGLVNDHDIADFRLRRLVAHRDFKALVEALEDAYPQLMAAVAREAAPNELAAHVAQLDGAPSTKKRFWRIVQQAVSATGATRPPNITLTEVSKRPKSVPSRGRHGIDQPQSVHGDPVARRMLEEEATLYQDRLRKALSENDFAAAEILSARLRDLRQETRSMD